MNIRKTNWILLIITIIMTVFTILVITNIIPMNNKILQTEILILLILKITYEKINESKFEKEINIKE